MRQEGLARMIGATALVSAALLLSTHSAFAACTTAPCPLITTGSYIAGYYNNGSGPSATTAVYGTIPVGIINYTNGMLGQASLIFAGDIPNTQATVNSAGWLSPTTSITSILSDPDTVSGGFVDSTGEIWDTLDFSNLPTGVVSSTTIGTLTLTITSSVAATGTLFGAQSAYAFDLYNATTFLPITTGSDCGVNACTGLLYGVGNGGAINASGIISAGAGPASTTYTINITAAELLQSKGQVAYIAEVAGYLPAQGPFGGSGTLTIDPSVTLTNLYPGVSVTSSSGLDYAPVPLPAAAWVLLSGLGGVGLIARRRRPL